LTKVRLLVNWK